MLHALDVKACPIDTKAHGDACASRAAPAAAPSAAGSQRQKSQQQPRAERSRGVQSGADSRQPASSASCSIGPTLHTTAGSQRTPQQAAPRRPRPGQRERQERRNAATKCQALARGFLGRCWFRVNLRKLQQVCIRRAMAEVLKRQEQQQRDRYLAAAVGISWAATQRAVASEGIEAGATEVTAAAVLEGSGIWEDAVDTVMIPRGKRGNEAGSSTSSSNGQQVGAGAPTALQLRGGASRKEHKARKKKARTPHAD